MIKKWIYRVLETITPTGVIVYAQYLVKASDSIPKEAKVVAVRGYTSKDTTEYAKLVLTDSAFKEANDRVGKYVLPKDGLDLSKVGVYEINNLIQASTAKTRRPKSMKLICVKLVLSGMTFDMCFTESQFNRCKQHYESLKSRLMYKLTLKQKVVCWLAKHLGLYTEGC